MIDNTIKDINLIARLFFYDSYNLKITMWVIMLLVIIAATFVISLMVRRKFWVRFSERYKWRSRFILFFSSLFVFFPLCSISGAVLVAIPGKITVEKPQLTATAIKLGLYGLYVNKELTLKLPPEKLDLEKCVTYISSAKAQAHIETCGNDYACFGRTPVTTRDAIIAKIKEVQATGSGALFDVCKNIDLTKFQ